MRRRTVILGLLAIWGVFAIAGFSTCRRPTSNEPSLSSIDPSEVSQAYWLAAQRASARSGRAVKTVTELQRKAKTGNPLADERVWAELAKGYAQASMANTEAVQEIKSLPQDRVDSVAVECVTELADFLAWQANLLRQSAKQCDDMAALLAMFHAEGDAFDWNSPKGKEYERREAELTSRMTQTVSNEGAVQKQRIAELTTKTRNAATALARKHGRDFPDLVGH
jgi:hypothetical protein